MRFDELLAEAAAVPLEGWDFSWFDGRATEQRPSWHYADRVAERLTHATAAVDLQTGGGEVYAYAINKAPGKRRLVATEAWQPEVAARNLNAHVVKADDHLPFGDATFDLVVSRHPVSTPWTEIARVLRPGGIFLSQQIGDGSNRELSEAMLGPLPPPARKNPGPLAEAAGLELLDVRAERLRAEFFDIGAVAYFLRKVIWTVPGFTIEKYRDRLRAVHEEITVKGMFVSHATRVLIEARRWP
ncbi:methyltransferase domain-containing protein [Paractinoplanes atraurantiacus]|uniref:Methyltransferase domain-containing protein n=1 Tax=Paractinoplanes atraurantiacus TaxID=1036182 RepID=A0A285F6D7_9ACTN|nr:methyltransferase domain-containing protein [Actinoplanes atraurantiacus]SNY06274.1 Methyltransferase domain-containing protein [Actinoplanes atraurantiacus]